MYLSFLIESFVRDDNEGLKIIAKTGGFFLPLALVLLTFEHFVRKINKGEVK